VLCPKLLPESNSSSFFLYWKGQLKSIAKRPVVPVRRRL